MSECLLGLIVVVYVVIVLAVADLFVSRRIIKRLERIEELLTPTTKESLRDSDNIADGKS
jgi:hypothetical protein